MDYTYNLTFSEMMSKIFVTNGSYLSENGIWIEPIDGAIYIIANIDCVGTVIKKPLVVDNNIVNMKFIRVDSQNDDWVSPPRHKWQYAEY